MSIPQDPVILLSYINTLLRDKYPTFEALCDDLDSNAEDIKAKLESINYIYDEKLNKFC